MANKYNIALIIVATGNYINFIPKLLVSVKAYFFTEHNVTVYLMTEKQDFSEPKIQKILIKHEPWPFVTLKKYNFITEHKMKFNNADFIFLCDADLLFVSNVGEEILPNQLEKNVGVDHPGFTVRPRATNLFNKALKKIGLPYMKRNMRKRGPYESNLNSTAFVSKCKAGYYYTGAFVGGFKDNFLSLAETISQNVNDDLSNNIIAVWHDESHLNKYFFDNPPKMLSASYYYPENENLPYEKKILALEKDHDKIRNYSKDK
jgi:histo-blood group ABO system transferase